MTRGTPGIDRALTVLTVLSTAPEHNFTLAEIVRRTGLSKATCHALLASLVTRAGCCATRSGRPTGSAPG